MEQFAYVIIPVMLIMWSVIGYHWWKGMEAEYIDEMMPYAIVASFAAFLFTGPFCVVVWMSFLYRAIWLSGMDKFERDDRVTFGSGRVFEDLDVVLTEAEWEDLCRRNGSKLPYPFAKVLPFPSPQQQEMK